MSATEARCPSVRRLEASRTWMASTGTDRDHPVASLALDLQDALLALECRLAGVTAISRDEPPRGDVLVDARSGGIAHHALLD